MALRGLLSGVCGGWLGVTAGDWSMGSPGMSFLSGVGWLSISSGLCVCVCVCVCVWGRLWWGP